MTKWVYGFGDGRAEGEQGMRNLLGGKGANLAEMSNIGLPVPPGFTVTTEVCSYYYAHGKTYPPELKGEVEAALIQAGRIAGKVFGDPANPLLVSVRSGARVSMPGMMDTVLNLGLNDVTVKGLAARTHNPRFAFDSYRRFIQMYGDVVMGVHSSRFEAVLSAARKRARVSGDADLGAPALEVVVGQYRALVKE